MRQTIFAVFDILLGGFKEDSPTSPSPEPFLIGAGFKDGIMVISNSLGSNLTIGQTPSYNVAEYDSVHVRWKTTFKPFPSPPNETYSVNLTRLSSTLLFLFSPTDSSQTYQRTLIVSQLSGPDSVRLQFLASSSEPGSAVQVSIRDVSLCGWR